MRNKFLKITVIAIMILLVCATVVNAYSFTATMTPSSTYVEPSTEFTIIIKIANVDVGTNGLNSLSGYLEYDTSVFEAITDSNIEGLNSWSPSYNSENGKIVLTKTTFVKSDESVFQLTLKTKSELTDGVEGTVTFKNIVGSNSDNEINATNISTTITIGAQPETNTNNTTNGTQVANIVTNTPASNGTILINTNTTNRTANNTTTNNTTTNGTTNNVTNGTTNSVVNRTGNNVTYYTNSTNTTGDNIPYTGVTDYLVYVILVAVAVALIFYIKYQKIDRM